jgi:hypothetical protein
MVAAAAAAGGTGGAAGGRAAAAAVPSPGAAALERVRGQAKAMLQTDSQNLRLWHAYAQLEALLGQHQVRMRARVRGSSCVCDPDRGRD